MDTPSAQHALFGRLLRKGPSRVQAALQAVVHAVRAGGDGAVLKARQAELAALFTPFLVEVFTTREHRVPDVVYVPFQTELAAFLRAVRVSEGTLLAAVRAVRVASGARGAVAIVGEAFVGAAADKRKRPVKHYVNMFVRLVQAGGEDVSTAYHNFLHAFAKWPVGKRQPFSLTRKMCRGIERAVYHAVRCHAHARDFSFEPHALRALEDTLWKRLARAGISGKLRGAFRGLVAALGVDEGVVRLAHSWATRPDAAWDGAPGDVTAVYGAEVAASRTRWDEPGKAEQGWGGDGGYKREQDKEDGNWGYKHKEDGPRARFEDAAGGGDGWYDRDRDLGSERRQYRRGRDHGDDDHHHHHHRRYDRGRGEHRDRYSFYGRDRDRDNFDERNADKLDVSMDRAGQFDGYFSPPRSSEELPVLGIEVEDDEYTTESSEEESTADTEVSQWARVNRAKEEERVQEEEEDREEMLAEMEERKMALAGREKELAEEQAKERDRATRRARLKEGRRIGSEFQDFARLENKEERRRGRSESRSRRSRDEDERDRDRDRDSRRGERSASSGRKGTSTGKFKMRQNADD